MQSVKDIFEHNLENSGAAGLRLVRSLNHFDTICFKNCVKVPEKILTSDQENCLSINLCFSSCSRVMYEED